jgi:hypothetical protein
MQPMPSYRALRSGATVRVWGGAAPSALDGVAGAEPAVVDLGQSAALACAPAIAWRGHEQGGQRAPPGGKRGRHEG